MQHYGLPTRLLDWSGSLLAATYFAVSFEPCKSDAAIWILGPTQLNKQSRHRRDAVFVLSGPEIHESIQAAFTGASAPDDILAVVGQDVDMRMTVQQGAFTIHSSDEPLENIDGAINCLAKLTIPADARPKLDDELWVLGVRRSSLFPDLANLALDLATDWRLIPTKKQEARINSNASWRPH